MISFQVTSLQPEDRPRWAELWTQYQKFYRIELSSAVSESTWQRLNAGRIHGLLARDESQVAVGIVHFLFHEDTWSTTPACYLQDLYVDDHVRGRGCARALIEAVARAAEEAGASPPYWLTHETNSAARRLYDRLGSNAGFIQYVYSPAPSLTARSP